MTAIPIFYCIMYNDFFPINRSVFEIYLTVMLIDGTKHTARGTDGDHIGGNIVRDHTSGVNHGIVTNRDTGDNDVGESAMISESPGRYNSPECILSFMDFEVLIG